MVGGHEAHAADGGEGLRRVHEGQGPPGARAERRVGVAPGLGHEPLHVAQQRVVHEDAPHRVLRLHQVAAVHHRLQVADRVELALGPQDVHLDRVGG